MDIILVIKKIKNDLNGNPRYYVKLFDVLGNNISYVLLDVFGHHRITKGGGYNITSYIGMTGIRDRIKNSAILFRDNEKIDIGNVVVLKV